MLIVRLSFSHSFVIYQYLFKLTVISYKETFVRNSDPLDKESERHFFRSSFTNKHILIYFNANKTFKYKYNIVSHSF